METITSRANPRVKFLRTLRQRKQREISSLFIVEGIHAAGQAIEAGAEIESIYYAADLLTSEFAQGLIHDQNNKGVPCFVLSKELFTSLADKEHPQGILIVVRKRPFLLTDLSPNNFHWGVALVSPQDPGNVGTIVRTLDAVGADGVLLLEDSVDETHPSVIRASMGAYFWHPIVRVRFSEFQAWALFHQYHIYGTSAHGDVEYSDIQVYNTPLILLLGSEREGLSLDHLAICEKNIRLPMLGRVTSLNLSVAAGVILYQMGKKMGIN